jgi:hypothetical protein
MSSPRRGRGHHPVVTRSRREVVTAAGGSAAVVIVTALLIWLMRPGPQFSVGTGGLFHRQPRVTWLVVMALIVVGVLVWTALRPDSTVKRRELVVGAGSAAVLVAAVVGGIKWPGGLVHHYPSQPKVTVPATTVAPVTTASTPTTVAGSSSTTPTTAAAPTSTGG